MKTNLSKYTLTEIFAQSAKAYNEVFPGLLKKLVIFSTSNIMYVSPYMVDKLSAHTKELQKLLRANSKRIERDGLYAIVNYKECIDETFNFTSITLGRDMFKKPYLANKKHENEISNILNFDHEIGHIVAGKTGRFDFHVGEGIADAFALIMYLKRFGNRKNIFSSAAYSMASHVVLTNSPRHYTSRVIFAVEKLSKEVDLSKISIKDAAWYARKIGIKYTLDKKILERINEAYKYPRQVYNSGKDEFLLSVLKTMLKNKNDEEIYRAGKLFISDKDIAKTIRQNCKKDSVWLDNLNSLHKHEAIVNFVLNPLEKTRTVARRINNKPF